MGDDLYGLYMAFFNFNPRTDLRPDNEVYGVATTIAPDEDEIMVLEQASGTFRERL